MMRKRLLAVALGLALGGCAVDQTISVRRFPSRRREVSIQAANDPPHRWWEQFGDPELNRLIQTALQENKDVKIAAARVEEYMGRYGVIRSAQFPQVGANAAGSRTLRSGESTLPPGSELTNDSYQVDLGVSFELDLWGNCAATESARAQLLATEEAKRTG